MSSTAMNSTFGLAGVAANPDEGMETKVETATKIRDIVLMAVQQSHRQALCLSPTQQVFIKPLDSGLAGLFSIVARKAVPGALDHGETAGHAMFP